MKTLYLLIWILTLPLMAAQAQSPVFAGQTSGMITHFTDTSFTIPKACSMGESCCNVEKNLDIDFEGDSIIDLSIQLLFVRRDCPAPHHYTGIVLHSNYRFCTYSPPQLPWMYLNFGLPTVFPLLYQYGDTIHCNHTDFPAPYTTQSTWMSGGITNIIQGELIHGGIYKDHEYLGFSVTNQGTTRYGWIQLSYEETSGINPHATCTVEGYAIQDPAASGAFEIRENGAFIYPNPTSGRFSIKPVQTGALHQIIVLNTTGQTVKTFDLESSPETAELDISDVSPGVYFVLIYADKKVFQQRILKR